MFQKIKDKNNKEKFIFNKSSPNDLSTWDWLMFFGMAVLCFILFCYHDILVTAQHSLAYLDGNLLDFYKASYDMDGTYGSNYLPSTFIVFALWNIPLKILSWLPVYYGDWGIKFVYWNKLLPTIIYFCSSYLIFRISKDNFDFSKEKAKMGMFLFVTAPLAFFSQFMFSQYDIFTVFFMLLGLYYYFKKDYTKIDELKFIGFMGIAVTFKYFALLIFFVLLLLRTKDVFKIIVSSILVVFPMMLEMGVYIIFDRKAFVKSVFGFTALENATGFSFNIGGVSINGVYLLLCMLLVWAYLTETKDRASHIKYAIFFMTGIASVLFSFMFWYPQWILFAVPFWIFSILISKKADLLLTLDVGLAVLYNVYVVNMFHHQADETLLRYGIFNHLLRWKSLSSYSVRDVYRFASTDLVFTLMVAIFIVFFIFSYPKYTLDRIEEPLRKVKWWARGRFLVATLSFIIPVFLCLPTYLEGKDLLWARYSSEDYDFIKIPKDNEDLYQEMTFTSNYKISSVKIYTGYDSSIEKLDSYKDGLEDDSLTVDLVDAEKDEIIASSTVKGTKVKNGDYTKFKFGDEVEVETGRTYYLRIYSENEKYIMVYIGEEKSPTYEYFQTYQQDYDNTHLVYNSQSKNEKNLKIKVFGEVLSD